MATNSSYSQKVLNCRGRACAKCGYCRDWYYTPHHPTKIYTKRQDAICTSAYAYGHRGFGPGCGGCCLCCVAHIPFGNLCSRPYYGGSGFLRGGLNYNIQTLAGVDHAARRRRNNAVGVATHVDLVLGSMFRDVTVFANGIADLTDDTLNARIALGRAHHDDGRLCECSDNQQ